MEKKEREGADKRGQWEMNTINTPCLHIFKSHNETHYYVKLIFDNKIKNYS